MFIRTKQIGIYKYLQVVENYRQADKVLQRVLLNLGPAEKAPQKADDFMRCLNHCSEKVKIVEALNGDVKGEEVLSIGVDRVMGRLWDELGIGKILTGMLQQRKFHFDVERAVYFTVLSRLFFPGSDRRAHRIGKDFRVEKTEDIELHHLYRAMAWLGENHEEVEEELFARNRDLFSDLSIVFYDTTSIYFEGKGGQTLGQYGYSKDHRSDERQMLVGAVLDNKGRPISCPMWPGNRTDIKTILEVSKRLKERFGVGRLVLIADGGMISEEVEKSLSQQGWDYILGVRMRRQKQLFSVHLKNKKGWEELSKTMQVKEVNIKGARYIICRDIEEAPKDAARRKQLVNDLRGKLSGGVKTLIGNKGYRRFLKVNAMKIDEEKIREESQWDGIFILKTNTALSAGEVCLRYKELWKVENIFRQVKSILETRPVFHKWDETIKGHVFCSFLALVVMKSLMERTGGIYEWDEIRQGISTIYESKITIGKKLYWVRSKLKKTAVEVFRKMGIAIPLSVREAV